MARLAKSPPEIPDDPAAAPSRFHRPKGSGKMEWKENQPAVSIPRRIRTPAQRERWFRAARGAQTVATMIRSFSTPNTRHLYEAWAKNLDREATEILERVRLYTGTPKRPPASFKGAYFAVVVEKEEK